ncbi:hypothetical protein X560_0411 [Listeria fleischmannii 1991]|uniref:Uncharacterized protein n=2 Tax=Listeria fleischmannii TaxID=1069827 RepID=A0A2X3H9E7_9LIST|nr:hypothetical protein [Listeria fleischmannii]EMG27505.1 hypothetical protein LFLEISCH_10719 [Listeria fleischmannii subsp. fleischmannii LU2006-1]KMT60991.1 hypothetical protein X560_0411 [Listeria fleischmannii 1991]SQC67345.1 Uncharacterised protein [Listeria fleischmannii subsp. fleischmannii]
MEMILEEVKKYEVCKMNLLAYRIQIIGMLSIRIIEETKKTSISNARKYFKRFCEKYPFLQEFEKEVLANFEEYISNKKIAE